MKHQDKAVKTGIALIIGLLCLGLSVQTVFGAPQQPQQPQQTMRPPNLQPSFRVLDIKYPEYHLGRYIKFTPIRAVYKSRFYGKGSQGRCTNLTTLQGNDQYDMTLKSWTIVIGNLQNVSRAEVQLNGMKTIPMRPGKVPGTLFATLKNVDIMMDSRIAQSSCRSPSTSVSLGPVLYYEVTAYGPGNKKLMQKGDGLRNAELKVLCCYF